MNKSHPAEALEYAEQVIAGDIPAGKYVRLACERFLSDLKRKDISFDEVAAQKACNFIQTLPHTKGKWAAKREKLVLGSWQKFIVCNLFGWKKKDGTRRFREAYNEIPRKNGKALDVATPILTTNGWKNHGDLVAGDFVFSPDGLPVMVQATTGQYIGKTYKMDFGGLDCIYAHEKHEWVTERTWYTGRPQGFRDGRPLPPVETSKIAETLRGGSRGDLVHRIPIAKTLSMPQQDYPIHPYVLGAWLGDGSKDASSIVAADYEVVDAIREHWGICRARYKKGKATMYSLSDGDRSQAARDVSFIARIRRLGLYSNKHIPDEYFIGSESQRLELLQGLLDTDGTISKRGQVTFTNTNQALAYDTLRLVNSLGMKATMQEKRAMLYDRDCGPCYNVSFYPRDDRRLFKIERKHERQFLMGSGKRRCMSRTIKSCEPIGDRMVNCIQVQGGLYLAGRDMITTHNSQLAAGIGLYMFCADDEFGAEVYSGATTEAQAWEVFRPAKFMADRTPALKNRFDIEVNAKTMVILSSGSRFTPLIGKPGDGSSPSCAIVDEYHEHDSDALYETMLTGMGARDNPLMLVITTAGSNLGGPCYEKRRDAVAIIEGRVKDDSVFALIYTIDEDDDWDSEESLVKANPNFGVSVNSDFLIQQLEQARRSASKQNAFRTKHLNQWVGAKALWMNALAWQRQKKSLSIADFEGCPCWMAVDLASKKDVAALVLLFRKGDAYYCIPKFYAPESAAEENDKYQQFALSGDMTLTPGNMTDYAFIERDIKELAEQVDLQDVAFDDWQANYLITRLADTSINVVNYNQTVKNMSEPMKECEARVLDRSFYHDGNPVMTWMMGNVAAKMDAKENIYPRKENDNDPRCKIDGPVALIMSVGRAMLAEETPDISSFLSNPVHG